MRLPPLAADASPFGLLEQQTDEGERLGGFGAYNSAGIECLRSS